MEPVAESRIRRHRGVVGDCHAKPLGPRQVLIVREEVLEGLGVTAWQVRANIAVRDLAESELVSGALLRFHRGPLIRITHECEVCGILHKYVPKEVFASLPGRRGSLGVIVRGGQLKLGDRVSTSRVRYPEVPERIFDRLAWVVERIPRGRVVTYQTLIELVGASRPYFRVLPTYLKRAQAESFPTHRVLTSAKALTGHVPSQAAALSAEDVIVDAEGFLVDPSRQWDGRDLYLSR